MKLREGNAFRRMCLFKDSGSLYRAPAFPQHKAPPALYRVLVLPSLYRTSFYRDLPRSCSNLLTMYPILSAGGRLAFDWNAFLWSIYSGEDPQNGFVIATHTPEENTDYLGNMFVVTVFEQNTIVEVYNSEGKMGNIRHMSKMVSVVVPLDWNIAMGSLYQSWNTAV